MNQFPTPSPRILISIAISLLILIAIYWNVDISSVLSVLRKVDMPFFIGSLILLVPTLLLSSMRFLMLFDGSNKASLTVATKLILSASTMNIVLPSKMGDVLKSIFMHKALDMRISLAISIVVFEKACDVVGLLAWCLLGLLLYAGDDKLFIILALAVGSGLVLGMLMLSSLSFADWFLRLAAKISPSSLKQKFDQLRSSWAEVHSFFWRSRGNVINITLQTLFIWFLQLLQVWMMAVSLNAVVPFVDSLGLSSLAIFAGLIPLTLAGIGTRDAATIFLFSPFMAAPAGAALGLMLTMRYVLPGLTGLPFLSNYIYLLRQSPLEPSTNRADDER